MDVESSSNLSELTDIIQAYWPYSMVLNPFAVLNQELSTLVRVLLVLWGGARIQGCAVLLAWRHRLLQELPVLCGCFSCTFPPVRFRRGMCMTRCRTRARCEASLTKCPRHPGKSKTHLDKVADKNSINLVSIIVDVWLKLLQEEELPFPWAGGLYAPK